MQSAYQARQIIVEGLVQGVGFRPHVYRLADEHDLKGWVRNTAEGVMIHIEGSGKRINGFAKALRHRPPGASVIHSVRIIPSRPEFYKTFQIQKSESGSDRITQISPDIAVCEACLKDMVSQTHRLDYPFINCTHCGPRFTIIRDLPYDRYNTTMAPFQMCETCRTEYESITDRRFHAQPVACHKCGPEYTLIVRGQKIKGIQHILEQCSKLIAEGGTIAIKGMGGFHLMCDAENRAAVRSLRDIKKRDGKPFAVMVRDIEAAGRLADLSDQEAELMRSWRRPIVLLKQKLSHLPENAGRLPRELNPGMATIGVMFPYMPFHHLMFRELATPAVVMTSGNLSDEPIVIDNGQALDTFGDVTDAVLVYNRDIRNRADDSVAFVAGGKPRMIRRSRGYVPEPVRLSFPVEGLLGAGAELNHCFAVGKGRDVLLSQHIGDLKDPSTYAFFEESVSRLSKLFRSDPSHVACDMHPDYLSTRYALRSNLPATRVQHHHAHVAACMAEFHLTKPVIGVCFDGTGLGSDGHIWGGEFLHADLNSFTRHTHFDYLPLPGGDKAAKEPWRTAISLLHQTFGGEFRDLDNPAVQHWRDHPEGELILQAIDRKLNTPLSSAAGRLFDAVAAITGVCLHNSFHAEGPMKLEALVADNVTEEYPFDAGKTIRFSSTIRAIVHDIRNRVPIPVISAKFHNTLVSVIFFVTQQMKSHCGTDDVVLTGGVFQNRYLLEKTEQRLDNLCNLYSPKRIPCNDAGIALGQIAVAAQKGPATEKKDRETLVEGEKL